MQCDKCKTAIERGEEREYSGQVLCDDCYMDALSPARTCDPWAVHSAKSLRDQGGQELQVSTLQSKILAILQETQGLELPELAHRLNIKPADLEREIAALRHMEKIRAAMKEGKKVICLW